jgi:hypothetical protein
LAGVRINEFLPAPGVVDWDNSGRGNERDEWIELYNAGATAVDLGLWHLDDAVGGSRPYRIPVGTVLEPGEFIVFYRLQTGISLEDTSDQVRLLKLDGTIADLARYHAPVADVSYSRDDAGVWHADWPASPGATNLPPVGSASQPGQ